jgi:hypothetical protein
MYGPAKGLPILGQQPEEVVNLRVEQCLTTVVQIDPLKIRELSIGNQLENPFELIGRKKLLGLLVVEDAPSAAQITDGAELDVQPANSGVHHLFTGIGSDPNAVYLIMTGCLCPAKNIASLVIHSFVDEDKIVVEVHGDNVFVEIARCIVVSGELRVIQPVNKALEETHARMWCAEVL